MLATAAAPVGSEGKHIARRQTLAAAIDGSTHNGQREGKGGGGGVCAEAAATQQRGLRLLPESEAPVRHLECGVQILFLADSFFDDAGPAVHGGGMLSAARVASSHPTGVRARVECDKRRRRGGKHTRHACKQRGGGSARARWVMTAAAPRAATAAAAGRRRRALFLSLSLCLWASSCPGPLLHARPCPPPCFPMARWRGLPMAWCRCHTDMVHPREQRLRSGEGEEGRSVSLATAAAAAAASDAARLPLLVSTTFGRRTGPSGAMATTTTATTTTAAAAPAPAAAATTFFVCVDAPPSSHLRAPSLLLLVVFASFLLLGAAPTRASTPRASATFS
jgi:hypothetical protein